MNNYIEEYYQKIKDGTVIVGAWVRMIYEYIIKGLETGLFLFSRKKAEAAVRFIESFCHHHEGELAPGPIKLELWQKALVSTIFGITDENGARHFREVFIVVARKNGKTLLSAAISAYVAFLDGEYGGRIYFAAPKLEQANLCFEAFHQMILHEPELDAMAQKRRTDIYITETNTTAKPMAFNAKKSDGLNISLAVADEIASWAGEPGLRFYEVIKSSFGARKQPLLISISTAGYVNESIYDELMKRSTRFLKGGSKESRLLPIIYQIDDIRKWNDITELHKSNPNLGVSVPMDYLLEEIAIADGSLSKRREFIAKYCNMKQNSSVAWLPEEAIEGCTGDALDLEQFRNSYAVGGIDLSRTTDLTAACIIIEKQGRLHVFCRFWLPGAKIEEATARDGLPYETYIERGLLSRSGENFVDYADCFEWFKELVEKYEIYPLQIGYDRYNALQLTQQMQGYGFHMDPVFQGMNLTPVIREAEGLIKDGLVTIGDNDLLKVHLLESAIKVDQAQDRCRLIKIRNAAHIDGTAALLDALCVRQKWWTEIGEQLKNED